MSQQRPKLLFFVTEDWYFCSHRLPLAIAAQQAGFDVGVITRINQHAELIRSHGLRLIPIELSRKGVNPFQELKLVWLLYRIYRREQPHIVHQVAIKPVLYGTLAARLSGVPGIVNAMAGLGFLFSSSSTKARMLRPSIRFALKKLLQQSDCQMILQNPEDVRLLSQATRLAPRQIHLIRGAGVDVSVFAATPEPSGAPVIMLAARLLWDKGVGVFVEAARLLQLRGIEARFALVGKPDSGNPAAVPERQIEQWVKQGLIEWWGHREDMAKTLAASHIVCLPSSYGEGIPKVLLEAAAIGRPIVASDIAGCREIVEAGRSGVLVPEKDPAALAEALALLLNSKETRLRYGQRARDKAVAEFDIKQVVRETLLVYRSMIAR